MGNDKIYMGIRKGCGDVEVSIGDDKGNIDPLLPGPSQDIYNHAPDFEFGYTGSGPSQLALALLLDATGDKKLAMAHHQDFKLCFVAGWKQSYFSIDAGTIRQWLRHRATATKGLR